jgi:hypothetical protein
MMAMIAGHANIGQITGTDFIAREALGFFTDQPAQDAAIATLVKKMVTAKREYWLERKVPEADWPGPTILLASHSADGINPRIWRIRLDGSGAETEEVLDSPFVRIEGSYNEVFSLLYGYAPEVLSGLVERLGLDKDGVSEVLRDPRFLFPVNKINFWTMPLQDAIDMAVFLANVQVLMDRFLPEPKACGGPIDVMVLKTVPQPEILVYPGKKVHHPQAPLLG